MPDGDHVLERRAKLLAGRLTANRESLRNALAPPGTRPPFSEQLPRSEALAWWGKNRYSDIGLKVVRGWKPEDVLELDRALAAQNEAEMYGGIENGIY